MFETSPRERCAHEHASPGPGETRPGLLPGYGLYFGLLAAYWGGAVLVDLDPAIGTSVSGVLGLRMVPVLVAAYLAHRLILAAARNRTFRAFGQALRDDLANRETLHRLAGIPLFVLGTVFTFDVYGAFKEAIPDFRPYPWDPTLARIDALLHGGHDPWTWTHALPGNGLVTTVLDEVYMAWYLVLLLSVLVVATWGPLRLRSRFFLAFVLCCALGGSLVAIAFASGGPAFYTELAGDSHRFAPLLQNLEGTRAMSGQRILWNAFETRSDKLYGGISAMPSMHVTLTVLVAFAAWRWHPLLGGLAAAYAGLILVGSVHLGWHYAIDGYAGILLAGLAWWVTGRMVGVPPPETSPASRWG